MSISKSNTRILLGFDSSLQQSYSCLFRSHESYFDANVFDFVQWLGKVVLYSSLGLMQNRCVCVCPSESYHCRYFCMSVAHTCICMYRVSLGSRSTCISFVMWHTYRGMPLFVREIFRGGCKAVSCAGGWLTMAATLEQSAVLSATHFWGGSSDVERMAKKRERGKNKVKNNGEQAVLWVCRVRNNERPDVLVA